MPIMFKLDHSQRTFAAFELLVTLEVEQAVRAEHEETLLPYVNNEANVLPRT